MSLERVSMIFLWKRLKTQKKQKTKRAQRDAKKKFQGAYAFAVGDLVMVAGKDNSANVIRRAKIMMKW